MNAFSTVAHTVDQTYNVTFIVCEKSNKKS